MSLSLSWKRGYSLLILFDYQWVQGLRNTGTKGADGKRGLLGSQILYGYINMTVTAKFTDRIVGRDKWRDIYLFI